MSLPALPAISFLRSAPKQTDARRIAAAHFNCVDEAAIFDFFPDELVLTCAGYTNEPDLVASFDFVPVYPDLFPSGFAK